jgi:diaminopimelate epimerase
MKVHGNGNDFIVLENLEGRHSSDDLVRLARLLCRRKFSLGADGILVIEKPQNGADVDFVMRIFNSDGSEGEMCGNGARAIARYAFEKKIAGASQSFMTLAGLIKATVEPPHAELDMGEISLGQGGVGNIRSKTRGLTFPTPKDGYPYFFLTVGVPHCVLLTEGCGVLDDSLRREIGRELSHDFNLFPEGANVTFAQTLSQNDVTAVTYERGVEDLTESCGTGCVAAAVALAPRRERTASGNDCIGSLSIRVHNPGGVNEVRLDFAPDNSFCHAWLKGRTDLVAEGRILEDALSEDVLQEVSRS